MEQSDTTESYICTVCKEIVDMSLVPLTADELKNHISPIMVLPTLDLCPLCGSPVIKVERSDDIW